MSGMSAREHILGRLRAAAPASAVDVKRIDADIDVHFTQRRVEWSQAELVALMQKNLIASHAEVWCADETAWPAQLATKLVEQRVKRVLLDPRGAEGAALIGALPGNIGALAFDRPIEQWKAELFDTVDAGFTVARSGIAATGTLVLAPDAGSPRTVSLVPPLHVALVYADTLHADLHAAAKSERWADGMPTNLVLASSPSKTSDIQQTLAFGAHGPRWLWVIIVTGRAGQGAAA